VGRAEHGRGDKDYCRTFRRAWHARLVAIQQVPPMSGVAQDAISPE
jgi:hypothetical protein